MPRTGLRGRVLTTSCPRCPDGVPVLDRVLHAPALDPDGAGCSPARATIRPLRLGSPTTGAVDPESLPPVGECLERIWEVFGEFPFATDASRANFLALLIAGIIGPACGPKPAFLGDKPTAGTGATLMMRTVAFLVGGAEPHWITGPRRQGVDYGGGAGKVAGHRRAVGQPVCVAGQCHGSAGLAGLEHLRHCRGVECPQAGRERVRFPSTGPLWWTWLRGTIC